MPVSRFINLEFGGDAANQSLGETQESARDELYYLNQARAALEKADFELALRHYAKVLEFNPQNAAAWTAQARMLIELGEFRDADSWAAKALEIFPSDPELLAAKAVALARNGDTKAALIFSDTSIEEQGALPYVWLARGDVLLARKEPRADYCFEKALMLAPGDWMIFWQAARIRLHYGQFAAALQLAQKAIAHDAGRAVLWLELGRCQKSLGLIDAAQNSFARALELDRDCRAAMEAMNGLRTQGVGERARGWWRRITK
jgi:tetratricopeptide (TPR) repeat protein